MLETRTQFAAEEQTLSTEERQALARADQKPLQHTEQVLSALQCFVNLAEERKTRTLHPDWWWYLDVLVKVPMSQLMKKPPNCASMPKLTKVWA